MPLFSPCARYTSQPLGKDAVDDVSLKFAARSESWTGDDTEDIKSVEPLLCKGKAMICGRCIAWWRLPLSKLGYIGTAITPSLGLHFHSRASSAANLITTRCDFFIASANKQVVPTSE